MAAETKQLQLSAVGSTSAVSASAPRIILTTDGGCILPNNGRTRGGWAVVLRSGTHHKELSGSVHPTTNNRMELTAVFEGLRALKKSSVVTIRTDSQYVITVCEKSGPRFRSGKKKNMPKNYDLLLPLLDELRRHEVKFEWIRGHVGDPDNERCDALASAAMYDAPLPSLIPQTVAPKSAPTPSPPAPNPFADLNPADFTLTPSAVDLSVLPAHALLPESEAKLMKQWKGDDLKKHYSEQRSNLRNQK